MTRISCLALLASATVIAGLLTGCSNASADPAYQVANELPDYNQRSFEQYREATKLWLNDNRVFMTDNHEQELDLVLPTEYRPTHPNGKGVLLVHGLGDSPYSFVDVAQHLADKGYLVRTILLPGHASKAGDLALPSLEDWQGVVHHHIQLLKRQTPSLWLGGYSTGANLATEAAIKDPTIDGLLLFSPAFEPTSTAVRWAGLASYFVTWADQDPEDNPLRYNSLPMNGAAVYYQTTEVVKQALKGRSYDKPVFMIMSEADGIIDTGYAAEVFQHTMTHPNKHLVWQGETKATDTHISRFSMKLPEQRIANGSHQGLLISPDNPLYGINGSNIICGNGQTPEHEQACINGAPVWFSSWGHQEPGKIFARLTYNPYFTQSMALMDQVMDKTTR
ncbi:alpha/beta hydrolase [Vibrio hippocampi]|uniref:2-succinyl-6-hydroxy-2, 4-cyclohexadiene-1-carboxylate synthase n=1 Tax=Vibrio hippocampi TaxID=654686 RepID=A0ABM8ZIM7_9VIBR|nr:alpha/beta fold hydrolase [Vibrio hippocampi]CAH0526094.1 2-succinyl-6-hydroxy-2, 4-cyclohexadiene-1-carboxylate synthase [Vibrio hippocampi]